MTVCDFFLRFVDEGDCFMSNRDASAARGCCRERVQSEQPGPGSSSVQGTETFLVFSSSRLAYAGDGNS
jgi:hypothetical protein